MRLTSALLYQKESVIRHAEVIEGQVFYLLIGGQYTEVSYQNNLLISTAPDMHYAIA